MRWKAFVSIVAGMLLSVACLAAGAQNLTDDQVAERIIQESIASYRGNCPCPFNRASNGSRCGGRSAYSRPGGASPICYRGDVTPQQIESYRRRHQ